MAVLILRAYTGSDPNGAALGTLSDAYAKSVTVEDNALGSGGFSISPYSSQVAWCARGNYIRVWRDNVVGTAPAAFWIDTGGDTMVSPDEQGGKEYKRAGPGPIGILRKARVWHRPVSGGDGAIQPGRGRWHWGAGTHPARPLVRLLEEADARGAIQAVTWDFTRALDSDGNPWTTEPAQRFNIPIGISLLEVVGIIREAGMHITMSTDLVLSMWEEPHDNDLSGSIVFTEGVDLRDTSERLVQGKRAASHVLVGGENTHGFMRYQAVRNATIQTALGERIEGFHEYPRTPTKKILRRVGDRKLRRWKKQLDGPLTLGVKDKAGQVALVNYTAGDTVTIDIPGFYDETTDRISAVTLTDQHTENGEYDPILRFGDLGHDPTLGLDMGGDRGAMGRAADGGGGGGGTGGSSPDPGHDSGGGGGGGSDTEDPAPSDPDEDGNGDLYLDDFDRTTELVEGAVAATVGTFGVYSEDRDAETGAFTSFGAGGLSVHTGSVGTTSGTLNFSPKPAWSSCTGFEPTKAGARHAIQMGAFTIGAHPAGAGGIRVHATVTPTAFTAGKELALLVKAGATAPTSLGDMSIVDTVPIASGNHEFFIPYASVPAEAGVLWIAVAPGTKATEGAHSCQFTWPYQTGSHGSWSADGAAADTWSVLWMVAAGGSDSRLGSLPSQADTAAWWPGDNPWETGTGDGTSGTEDDYGVDGASFFFESSTPDASYQFSVLPSDGELPMEAEQWELLIRWRLTTAAVPADPGDRYAHFDWANGDGLVLYFGDTEPEGIAVVGATTDKVDRSLGAGFWNLARWSYDGVEAHARVWPEGTDEPQLWDVTTAVAAAPDPDTYGFRMIGRLGNDGGTAQRFEVDYIRVIRVSTSGSTVRRVLNHGDGEGPFDIGEAFTPGTLRAWVDDIEVTPFDQIPDPGSFWLGGDIPVYHDESNHTAGCAQLVVQYEKA